MARFTARWMVSTWVTGSVSMGVGSGAALAKICICPHRASSVQPSRAQNSSMVSSPWLGPGSKAEAVGK